MTRKFQIGDRVRKIRGSSWQGHVRGFYSTTLTPYGCCVESEHEIGSVQIYPERALEAVSTKEHSLGQQLAEARATLKNIASVDVREAGAAHRLEQMQIIARNALQSDAPAEGFAQAQVDETECQLAAVHAALERLRAYAASVWFDEADASDEEKEVMEHARDALKGK
jgi:hypothetical protein